MSLGGSRRLIYQTGHRAVPITSIFMTVTESLCPTLRVIAEWSYSAIYLQGVLAMASEVFILLQLSNDERYCLVEYSAMYLQGCAMAHRSSSFYVVQR
ncbi:hypothetical protein J6590_034707 [Homalodisca vitripennis]|nr:hypothetical protein J6590_034707 [Homalodisca vitripennis]